MLLVGCRYSAVSPIYMSNDRLEPFNYHNIAFKRCADVVSLERLDRLWFFRHHWFVKIGWFGRCWTDLLAFWGVWNRSRILNFGPDRLFFRFSRALVCTHICIEGLTFVRMYPRMENQKTICSSIIRCRGINMTWTFLKNCMPSKQFT